MPSRFRTVLVAIGFAMIVGQPATTAWSQEKDVLKGLRREHPRVLIVRDDIERTRALMKNDETVRRYWDQMEERGLKILDEPPVEYIIEGPRLLAQSSKCNGRVQTLAALYLFSGDQKWVDRAVKEMAAAADFPDWNPSHFLDTAIMTMGFAIGYDWMYDALTPEQRTMIRTAIVKKGLGPGREAYETKAWWVKSPYNWNQTCNGGLLMGALAIADEEPELAKFIVSSAVRSFPLAMKSFAPDGGWDEGPTYWQGTVSSTVQTIAALNSALGQDFGLSDFPGFDKAGSFRLHVVGPSGMAFNYADAREYVFQGTSLMYWLGSHFNHPHYYSAGGGGAYGLFWHRPYDTKVEDVEPLDRFFAGTNVVMMRSAWNDARATWVGFKGGKNAAAHAHLDLGTFVFETLGKRWAIDLGPDDYNAPGFFDDRRWNFYRMSAVGHNTILLDGKGQPVKAIAPILSFDNDAETPRAIADLSQGYADRATRVWRGIALVDHRQSLLIQDEFESESPREYAWQMHTRAEVSVDGRRATLTLGDEQLIAEIVEPENATFSVESATPPLPEMQNEGVRKLVARLAEKSSSARIAVLLRPAGLTAPVPEIRPLAEWPGRLPDAK